MSLAFASVLIIAMFVSAFAVAVGIPLFFGIMAYDIYSRSRPEVTEFQDTSARIAVERGIARAFVVAGGAFWAVTSFAGLYSVQQTGTMAALQAALIPLVACTATLIIGWYYERFAAVLLALASVATVAWGVIYQFEMGVWVIMTFALIGPALTASVLFWLARRDQEAFERATSLSPQLALVFAARSSLS